MSRSKKKYGNLWEIHRRNLSPVSEWSLLTWNKWFICDFGIICEAVSSYWVDSDSIFLISNWFFFLRIFRPILRNWLCWIQRKIAKIWIVLNAVREKNQRWKHSEWFHWIVDLILLFPMIRFTIWFDCWSNQIGIKLRIKFELNLWDSSIL